MSDSPENIHLQQFGLKDSSYERPNQNWVCGRQSEGNPCTIGPDNKGCCLVTSECRPLKKGDRWVCTRRDSAAALSPCKDGPLPDGTCACPVPGCSPVRSLRAKRKRLAFASFALSVGILCFFLFGSQRSNFVMPGELTDAHAQVLKSHRAGNCAACHDAGSVDATQWIKLALAPAPGAVQNAKCLACHGTALGPDAGLPHSLSINTLAKITAAVHITNPHTVAQLLANFSPAAPKTSQGDLACANCHQEHGDRHRDLKTLSDIRCQVCHKDQFQSFAHGHPEFKAVHQDRAGIAFNHATHAQRMPNGKLDCARCHVPDPVGKTMQFTSFEEGCVGCHDQGKLDHHGDQIRNDVHIVLQLPTMTPGKTTPWPDKTLAPATALTPMLEFLIAGDDNPVAINALKSLASDSVAKGSTDDWDTEDETKSQLATAIKKVVKELSLPDEPALRARISRAAGLPAQSPTVTALLDELIAANDITKSWQQHSLPRLADDLAGKSTTAPTKKETPADWKPPTDSTGWFIDTDAVSVNYRASHDDDFDKSWIDLLAASLSLTPAPKFTEKMSNENFLAGLRTQLFTRSTGSCIKCHTIQPLTDSFFINWNAAGHATRIPGYPKFDHRPHLTLLFADDKCSSCHQLQTATAPQLPPQPALAFLTSTAPNHAMSPHDKASCAVCHNPTGAPDSCLTCHMYHMTR